MIEVNSKCPSFETEDETGKKVSLNSLKGKNFILYFYPKDDTPGCTIEANEFNKLKEDFTKLNCEIFGISKDSAKSHLQFKEKYCLSFPLLLDTEGEICNNFGVIVEKSMFGKKYMGISRDTFLINTNGEVAYIWRNVTAAGHAASVLEELRKI